MERYAGIRFARRMKWSLLLQDKHQSSSTHLLCVCPFARLPPLLRPTPRQGFLKCSVTLLYGNQSQRLYTLASTADCCDQSSEQATHQTLHDSIQLKPYGLSSQLFFFLTVVNKSPRPTPCTGGPIWVLRNVPSSNDCIIDFTYC